MNCQVFHEPPIAFQPVFEIAGCFCEHEHKLLYLQRSYDDSHGGSWCLPAGGREPLEQPLDTCLRELHEETGLRAEPALLTTVGTLFIQHGSQLPFAMHLFRLPWHEASAIVLDPQEHIAARWCTIDEVRQLPLIPGGLDVLEFYLRKRAA